MCKMKKGTGAEGGPALSCEGECDKHYWEWGISWAPPVDKDGHLTPTKRLLKRNASCTLTYLCVKSETATEDGVDVGYTYRAACRCVLGSCPTQIGPDKQPVPKRTEVYYKDKDGTEKLGDKDIEDVLVLDTSTNEMHFVTVFK